MEQGNNKTRIEWRLGLAGDRNFLKELSSLFSDGDIVIRTDGEHYYLCGSIFDGLPDNEAVLERGTRVVECIYAATNLLSGGSPDLLATDPIELFSDETETIYKKFVETSRVSDNLILIIEDGAGSVITKRPTDDLPKWLSLAEIDDDVAKVLRLSCKSMDWVNLYRILEAIETDVDPVEKQWITERKKRLFKHTANSVHALGDEARHGQESTDPPRHPMSYGDASFFIQGLIHSYLRYKLGQSEED
jgi:hypothetical protein